MLGLEADGGHATIDCSAAGPPALVEFGAELTGDWSYAGGILTLSELLGRGKVTVSFDRSRP